MPTVLITGSNRGIGLALSREFLTQGWHVLACCRQPETADSLQALAGDSLEILALDVGNDDSIAVLRQSLGKRPIDLLLNNAGIAGDQQHYEFGDMNYDSWGEIFRINTMAPMKMMEALLGNLEAGSGRHVANISSGLASIASQEGHMLPYSVSKSALNSTMKSLSVVLKGKLRVNLFSPGWVQTDMGGPDAPLTVEQSATALFRNITGLGPEDTGRYLNLDGMDTPW